MHDAGDGYRQIPDHDEKVHKGQQLVGGVCRLKVGSAILGASGLIVICTIVLVASQSKSIPSEEVASSISLDDDDFDYYEILGIKRTASTDEIKKAYRAAAMRWHPDKNKGDPKAETMFKKVGEAYEGLSDDEKRGIYDKHGREGIKRAASGGPGMNPFDIFNMFFGGKNPFEALFGGGGGAFGGGPFGGGGGTFFFNMGGGSPFGFGGSPFGFGGSPFGGREEPEPTGPSSEPEAQALARKYALVGSWDDWKGFVDLVKKGDTKNNGPVFVASVQVPVMRAVEFQIVCDRDWKMRLFPQSNGITIIGPSEGGHGRNWKHSAMTSKSCLKVKFYPVAGAGLGRKLEFNLEQC
eukprot:gnl/MRDRNA2_/MRDRNA2_127045_c0_seq1.p1 gnl/MRDRNA2_/MRDRNA2_127045_c0~~gnl/MRDRNA2_/MRDRNA2_127045_c0_seq1.p1  ORF type:complete len:352 (-),score=63.64 gnl/MRDRNA2_/MRDRNA2_127045_c0_seq1:52-1107(-)